MAHFYARISGKLGQKDMTRTGTKQTGIAVTAETRTDSIETAIWHDAATGKDWLCITRYNKLQGERTEIARHPL